MKTILITGCARRLGLNLVKHFLVQDYRVIGVTRESNDELLKLQDQEKHNFLLIECDSYDTKGAFATIEACRNEPIDILVNNASCYEDDGKDLRTMPEKFQMFFDVHMMYPTLLCEWLGEQSVKRAVINDAIIINITDIFADNPSKSSGHYCSTKAGLESITKSIAKKYAPFVRANSIQPGPVKFLPSHSDEAKSKVLSETLLASEGGFECLIKTTEFIINNHYLTGTCIKVDGGRAINRG